jgi:hypothetical protein
LEEHEKEKKERAEAEEAAQAAADDELPDQPPPDAEEERANELAEVPAEIVRHKRQRHGGRARMDQWYRRNGMEFPLESDEDEYYDDEYYGSKEEYENDIERQGGADYQEYRANPRLYNFRQRERQREERDAERARREQTRREAEEEREREKKELHEAKKNAFVKTAKTVAWAVGGVKTRVVLGILEGLSYVKHYLDDDVVKTPDMAKGTVFEPGFRLAELFHDDYRPYGSYNARDDKEEEWKSYWRNHYSYQARRKREGKPIHRGRRRHRRR